MSAETAAETAFDASLALSAPAISPAPAAPARARRGPALRGLFAALAWTLSASAGTLALLASNAAHAQGTGEPIVIPGPGEKNPDALAAMSKMVTSPAAPAGVTAQRANAAMQPTPAALAASMRPAAGAADRFEQAAKADGAIVIAGTGEASAARPGMASGLTRVNLPVAASRVMPVVVTPAVATIPARGRETNLAPRAIAMNPPASGGYAAVAAVPEGQQDGESIRRAALAWLQQQVVGLPGKVTITVANVFPRGLAACTTMQPFVPAGTRMWGRTTVGVRCAGERPWTLYLQAKISVQATYYTASRAIAPGEPLSAADLVARDGDLTLLPQAVVTDPSQAIGAVALVRVPAGLPLRQDMLRSASSVTIGQTVRVVAQGPGFSISSEGSAMNNASPGQQVRVKTAGGQIISGIVKEGGTVEIQL
ncbi:flagellar basal body P-ring formation chaperone FlgA [Paraburkholderia kururiensis]|uniref:flagellar basal body P-ring formation chaperone FlgA n=1 Tax=Paraburkholderia kururiensis TaxID=984307 RepID=UPI00157B0911|nr:flagellar basal body P-ring formation chaperone FlgA [Paraburkholderia kururiensis]